MYTENRYKPTSCLQWCNKLFLKKQKPPLPRVNRVDPLNSSGIQPAVISDFKPSATCDKEITVKGYSENVTTMKTEMKPSSTATTEKRMSSRTVFETKIKTDQKLFPSSNQTNADGTQCKTEIKLRLSMWNHPRLIVENLTRNCARKKHFNPTLPRDSNHGITSLKARNLALNVAFVFLSCRCFLQPSHYYLRLDNLSYTKWASPKYHNGIDRQKE